MMAVMTFNVGICVAVVGGRGAGYMLAGCLRRALAPAAAGRETEEEEVEEEEQEWREGGKGTAVVLAEEGKSKSASAPMPPPVAALLTAEVSVAPFAPARGDGSGAVVGREPGAGAAQGGNLPLPAAGTPAARPPAPPARRRVEPAAPAPVPGGGLVAGLINCWTGGADDLGDLGRPVRRKQPAPTAKVASLPPPAAAPGAGAGLVLSTAPMEPADAPVRGIAVDCGCGCGEGRPCCCSDPGSEPDPVAVVVGPLTDVSR